MRIHAMVRMKKSKTMESQKLKTLLSSIFLGSLLIFPTLSSAQEHGTTGASQAQQSGIFVPYPQANYGTGEQKALIEKGEYLTKAGDCIACHTDTNNNGEPFAGGLAIKTPFGTLYSHNITKDPETGLGKWSDQDFIRAMQEGIGPDGSYFFPAFPYTSFHYVNKDDILAIKAYLFSLPGVRKANRDNDMMWPFGWRFLQFGWRLLFFDFHKGEYQYDPARSKEWNRGAYLVLGLGHCGECHTPRNMLGAMKQSNFLRGAFIEGYYAPDITADGLEGVSVDEIVKVFTHGEKYKGAGKVGGPMAEVNNDSLHYMSQDDLKAIAVYLKTVKSKPLAAAGGSGKITADTGKDIYEAKCAVCHTSGAAGAPRLGDVAAWDERVNKQGMPLVFQHAINGLNSMPPKGACMTCSDDEIKAAVQYIVDNSKPGSASAAAPAISVSAVPQLTMADGKRIYEETCSVCHSTGLNGSPKIGDYAAWAPRVKRDMDVLFKHAINGYYQPGNKYMMPPKGTCMGCTNAEIQAAVKYMVQQSNPDADYSLW